MNQEELIRGIELAFDGASRPEDKDYTTSKGGEAYEESSEFFGKAWRELDYPFLETFRDVLFWFTPTTFVYYLPAFLREYVRASDQEPIYVISILQILREFNSEEFTRARMRLLSKEQIDILLEWLSWLERRAKEEPNLGILSATLAGP